MPSFASASFASGLLTQLENHSFARRVQHLFASVVGERKVERAAVGVDVAELVALEHDCGGAPGGGLGAYAGPCSDFVEHGCGGRGGGSMASPSSAVY
jgi:hypothetical protein